MRHTRQVKLALFAPKDQRPQRAARSTRRFGERRASHDGLESLTRPRLGLSAWRG